MNPIKATDETARLLHDIGTTSVNKFTPLIAKSFVKYGANASGADDADCAEVFSDFGLSSSRTRGAVDQAVSGSADGTYYAGQLEEEMITNRRPCMVGGYTDRTNRFLGSVYSGSGGAHEWVVEGAQQDVFETTTTCPVWDATARAYVSKDTYGTKTINSFLYINWGWEGSCNGWLDYHINYTQASLIHPNYQYCQTVIYNIQPK